MNESVEANTRAAFVAGLRAVADFLDDHPDFPTPSTYSIPAFQSGAWTPADFARCASMLGGTRSKDANDNWIEVRRPFGPLTLVVFSSRDAVCEKRIVGVETVEVDEEVTPAVTRKVTVEREIVEWDCKPVLSGALSDA